MPRLMIYLNGIGFKELSQILVYIYDGEVQLFQDEVDDFNCPEAQD